MRIHYTKDQNGKEILCDESGSQQVMMEWEKDYMEKCIQALNPRGRVLEIGFGMGYSAEAIITSPGVLEYTVIECSPEVWEKFEKFKEKFGTKVKINLVKGRWQDVLHTLGEFECTFFDDFNYEGQTNRILDYIYQFMKSHAGLSARVGCYSNSPMKYDEVKYLKFENYTYNAEIPDNCRYTAGVCIPIMTKISNDVVPFPRLRPRMLNTGKPLRGVPSGAVIMGDIKIHKNFVSPGTTFKSKLMEFCGRNIDECILTKNFNYTSDGLIGILFSDEERSGTCSITLDDMVTIKNVLNTFITFKKCKIKHTIEDPIKVYLLYL